MTEAISKLDRNLRFLRLQTYFSISFIKKENEKENIHMYVCVCVCVCIYISQSQSCSVLSTEDSAFNSLYSRLQVSYTSYMTKI